MFVFIKFLLKFYGLWCQIDHLDLLFLYFRRIEYSESSSDSETEEGRNINLDVVQDDDRELSSLRDGLRPDLSSIHVMSGACNYLLKQTHSLITYLLSESRP